ncbi:NAD-dependent epimerase/dehydratase family protein [Pseudomonas sp. MAFF 302030]|uniref:NAD-dependent epimerase/dehydratase family protein n=1 Tax=Pseudomonas morbosilactucae TaxID=2938197 RepID=A0A9X1Z115_9PSED|nr:NAD-dependent epimerase/dehydratase family protein [Pseudomonas morbosilactucae]MCK9801676.1 NAD-dependent epimerase/dehydratase family protein [Pseudomonas morbosilactucae]
MSRRILLTGASGFIGQALAAHLIAQGHQVSAIGRRPPAARALRFFPGELNNTPQLAQALEGVECVVHLAGRAHQLRNVEPNPLEGFRSANRDLSLLLANEAVKAGVRRFVFLSSIGVNGASSGKEPFVEASLPAPHSDYALSKFEAEQALWADLSRSEMELTVVRPPLVYAESAPGNFARLLRLVASGVPLPFARIDDKRSMIALDNLVTLIETCAIHPAAANELFLAADGEDLSIGEIINLLALGMGRKARLWPVSSSILAAGASLLGRRSLYMQLCASLQVDASKSRRLLGWHPSTSAHDALFLAGKKYSDNNR